MNGLYVSLAVLAAAAVFSFTAGLITRNYSHVDRLWSVLPPVYVVIWMPEYVDKPGYLTAAFLVILWGIRLTANFAIKGGYRFSLKKGFTEEDYRWAHMRRAIPGRLAFELFNLFFISIYQLGLIFLFTLPLYYYGMYSGTPGTAEIVLYCISFILLAIETTADIQQLRFHRRKKDPAYSSQPRYRLGFNTFGLWRFSRHPNYVCEMGQWIVFYLYLVAVTGHHHWSGGGAVLLVLLFAGSTVMAERITASKYPMYADWKKSTAPWIPNIDMPFRLGARKEFWNKIEDSGQD